MEPEDWKPVYLTDAERAVIALNLIENAETNVDLGKDEKAKHLFFLAGLITYGPGPKVRA